jgi:hypothetical protein
MLFLTHDELVELTDRIQSDAQARELDNMCIPYKRRRDKSLVVLRAAVETALGACGVKIEYSEPRLHLT